MEVEGSLPMILVPVTPRYLSKINSLLDRRYFILLNPHIKESPATLLKFIHQHVNKKAHRAKTRLVCLFACNTSDNSRASHHLIQTVCRF